MSSNIESPVFQRPKRERKPKLVDAEMIGGMLVDEALQDWSMWLAAVLLPVAAIHRPTIPEDLMRVYESTNGGGFGGSSRVGHGDPVLMGLLEDERRWGKAVSVHAILCEMPAAHRQVLAAHAFGLKQVEIAELLDKSTRWIRELMGQARRSLSIMLVVRSGVMVEDRTGAPKPAPKAAPAGQAGTRRETYNLPDYLIDTDLVQKVKARFPLLGLSKKK
jgi:hypothetical protein